jgi:hypothetical protein
MERSQACRTRSDLIPKLKPRELMRALLQMTMETEDTTERLSAPTLPSWNFSPATPISTRPPQQEDYRQSERAQKKNSPAPEYQATPPASTCEAREVTFRSSNHPARTPGSSQEPRPSRPKLPTSLLPKNRTQGSENGSARRARDSEPGAEPATARRPERRAGAWGRAAGAGSDGLGLASRLGSWPLPPLLLPRPRDGDGSFIFLQKKEKILLRVIWTHLGLAVVSEG